MKLPQLSRCLGLASSAFLFVALAPTRALAQCDLNFGPATPDFRVNDSTSLDQKGVRVARKSNGYTFTWTAGGDVWARRYGQLLNPVSSDVLVNTTLTSGVQDEPDVAYSVFGNSLIAWTDRNANDGLGMGVIGRVYTGNGLPLGAEFSLSPTGAAGPQWRPNVTATPDGGFVATWSADWDGDAMFRIFDSTGAPVSGEIQVNDYADGTQVDPAAAVNTLGTIFIAFVDYTAHGSVGTLFNVYGRTFTSAGVPNEAVEFALTTTTGDGNQRNPRVAADGLNRFVVVWESQIHDGSGYGVFARRFDASGVPLGPEFQVNTVTASDQLNPAVTADSTGSFVVLWNDSSSGNVRIRGQRFDTDAQPLAGEFAVNQIPLNGVSRPSLAAKWLGHDYIVAYSGPGDGTDVFAKRFTSSSTPTAYGPTNNHSVGCAGLVSGTGTPSMTDPNPFLIQMNGAINQSVGTMWFSQSSAYTPFIGRTLLLAMPAFRTAPLTSGGNPVPPQDCSGVFSLDFNALIQGGTLPFLQAGTQVSAQFLFRDVNDPMGYGMGLSNGLRFTICP